MKTVPSVTNELENLILYALEANSDAVDVTGSSGKRHMGNGMTYTDVDISKYLGVADMRPKSAYVVISNFSDRILAVTPELLLAHPAEIIGDTAENLMFDDKLCIMKWMGWQRIRKPSRTLAYFGKPAFWYEIHYRTVALNGASDYLKRIVALDSKGYGLPVFFQKTPMSRKGEDTEQISMIASLIEDTHRLNSMLVEVKDAVELKFATYVGEHKELFALRDAPLTPKGRRKSIVHWVAEHTRRPSTIVKTHVRGVREITMDGISIRLSPQ